MAIARTRPFLLLLILACAVVLGGCFTTSSRMHGIADSFERDMPGVDFDHQFGLTLGRVSLGMAKGIAKWGMDDEAESEFAVFQGVKKVELATFEAHGDSEAEFPAQLERSLGRRGWETLARFKDDGELGWVVYRLDKDKLKNVMVVVLDHGELTLVRLAGRLDRVVSAALAYSRDEVMSDDFSPLVSGEDELGL